MGLFEIRSNIKSLNPPDPRRSACVRSESECVVLLPQGTRSAQPPVRIFVGTEPGQHRAERALVWSIEKNRDPSRAYEIYLMKDLAGFDRRGWTTGFTNYRFAVPHLAGGLGRAIFNDVDEAYFGDPADLFDCDMGGHGYLATSDTETSVMLLDCARMARAWPLESCQRELKKRLLKRSLRENPGIRGDLPDEWTARDEEFEPGFSKLQHWTTLHTQPWRPVPGRFVYQPSPTGQLWHDLDREADAAHYQVFSAARPSSLYTDLVSRLSGCSVSLNRKHVWASGRELRDVARRFGAKTVLDYGLARSSLDPAAGWLDLPVNVQESHFDLVDPDKEVSACDGVLCEGVLEFLPDEDVPWVIDDLFSRASRFVYATIRNDVGNATLPGGSEFQRQRRDLSWWLERFEAAGRCRPDIHWSLEFVDREAGGRARVRVRDNGCAGAAPLVWVLRDDHDDSTSDGPALAKALGWDFEKKDIHFGRMSLLHALGPPWPDVVISTGRRSATMAHWIRKQDEGRTRLVHVGREGGEVADRFNVVVTPAWARLWPHPNRIEPTESLVADPEERASRPAPPDMHPIQRIRQWVERRANTRPLNLRGTARPQQGLEYLCARLIERGIVWPVPDRDLRDGGTPFIRKPAEVATGVRDRLGLVEDHRCQT